jgi:XTP/dITP diphosphohydrolase
VHVRFATSNSLKLQEAVALVPEITVFDYDLPEIQAVDVRDVVADKIRILAEMNLPFPVFVEDTGLEIPSLGSLPGALVKWFVAGVGAGGLAKMVLGTNDSIPAVAVSAVAAFNGVDTYYAVGRVEGSLVHPRGAEFGWNSIFQPREDRLTFGEMSNSRRLALSMRRAPILDSVSWLKATGFTQNPG